MFLFGKKKIQITPFTLGVFGKLPFYKDFLYSSFGGDFDQLKGFFDSGMDMLHRSGYKRPYVMPARNFYLKCEDSQNDLVGCVWDSHDGLRGFPFIIAAPMPKKIRKHNFPDFWAVLTQFWGYLGEAFQELRSCKNPSEFYQLVKGSRHQLNPVEHVKWADSQSPLAVKVGLKLNDGLMARMNLSDLTDEEIDDFLAALHLDELPSMVLWPRDEWRKGEHVVGYFGTMGLDDLQITFFPPEKPEDSPENVGGETGAEDPPVDEVDPSTHPKAEEEN